MIEKVEFEGFNYIDGGVCAAQGFKANGIQCGLKHEGSVNTTKKNDLAVIIADKECTAAAVYTTNKVKGAPIQVTRENIADGKAWGVIVNSVNANTCNADGVEKAQKMCELVSEQFDLKPSDFIVASTGVIGQPLPIRPIKHGMHKLCQGVSYTGNTEAVNAIMTTDTMPKECAVEFELGGKKCVMGGMLKGSGMIHPNMATTLTFITTDAAISHEYLQRALSDVVKTTLNMVSVDGDTSTNDMVCVMANGNAGNALISEDNGNFRKVKQALYIVMMNMTRLLAKDGEGATKLLECVCSGAPTLDTAITVAKSVIRSPLFKCAMFGEDANWGRVLCAVGYADAEFDINKVDVDLKSANGVIRVCRNGAGIEFSEEKAKEVLSADEIIIDISLNQGDAEATAWGCDLTYDYVKINGDYRS